MLSAVVALAGGADRGPTTADTWCTVRSGTAKPPVQSAKKGVGTWYFDGVDRALKKAALPWFYSWQVHHEWITRPDGTEFVPMIWGADMVEPRVLAAAAVAGRTVLGFNEPDLADQSHLSVDEAVDLWPYLVAMNRRLGSPAPSSNGATAGGWLDRFMTKTAKRGHRVDFVALHWYGTTFADPNAAALDLCRYLAAVHDRYGKPVWLTEFALVDFARGVSNARYPSARQQEAFVRAALPMLERLPFLERYAWFALSDSDSGFRTGLYSDGYTLTRAGAAYLGSGA